MFSERECERVEREGAKQNDIKKHMAAVYTYSIDNIQSTYTYCICTLKKLYVHPESLGVWKVASYWGYSKTYSLQFNLMILGQPIPQYIVIMAQHTV